MRIPDWDVKIQFKNFAEYYVPFESLRYVWGASRPGNFSLAVPMNAETMDILRGSEVTFLYKGEEAFTGKITNRVPDEDSGIITLEGLDWLGLMNERQISFMGYQTKRKDGSGYTWDGGTGGDAWAYAGLTTGVPGMIQDIEGAELILRMLRHFTGNDMYDTEFGDPDDMPYVDRSITYKPWRFEGETLFQSIEKVAKVMQASSLRFGYHFWVDGKKNWWLRRYGDQIYAKPLQAAWSPPKEDVSTIINHLHFIGGIATPFPSDRESLTDLEFLDGDAVIAKNIDANQWHAEPTSKSKGWGCWIRRSAFDTGAEVKLEGDGDLGFVTGKGETSIHMTMDTSPRAENEYSWGIYYEINNQYADFRDENYPDGEIRNWSDRAQLDERKTHKVMTLTFYLRGNNGGDDLYPIFWPKKLCSAKLKIYTGTPSFPPSEDPYTDCFETAGEVYELNITDVLDAYYDKMVAWENDDVTIEWMRIAFTFYEEVDPDTYYNEETGGTRHYSCNPGGGAIRPKIEAITEQGGNLDVLARWDVTTDRTLPDPEDIWGFGLEFYADCRGNQAAMEVAFDHVFFGFGEINVERWDDISMQANRHVEKWIQDRKCHAWNRGEHLADVLLDSMKYSQKSRNGTMKYFNPELRPNMLIPVSEFGVEWMYVLNQISVEVNAQGTTMKLALGSVQPDTDELFDFYELQRVNAETGGVGKGQFDWVVNTPCQTNCERYCQFACLSDWSSVFKRGGSVCQTARETTCQRCESAEEVNPCVVSCLKYSQIAAISQRPPSERTDIDNVLLFADGSFTGVVPDKEPVTKETKPRTDDVRPRCAPRFRMEIN